MKKKEKIKKVDTRSITTFDDMSIENSSDDEIRVGVFSDRGNPYTKTHPDYSHRDGELKTALKFVIMMPISEPFTKAKFLRECLEIWEFASCHLKRGGTIYPMKKTESKKADAPNNNKVYWYQKLVELAIKMAGQQINIDNIQLPSNKIKPKRLVEEIEREAQTQGLARGEVTKLLNLEETRKNYVGDPEIYRSRKVHAALEIGLKYEQQRWKRMIPALGTGTWREPHTEIFGSEIVGSENDVFALFIRGIQDADRILFQLSRLPYPGTE